MKGGGFEPLLHVEVGLEAGNCWVLHEGEHRFLLVFRSAGL
jgi:hypothetical protein